MVNVSRPRTGVKIHQVSIKTPRRLLGLPRLSGPSGSSVPPRPPEKSLSGLSKIHLNLPKTPTGQILNEMNDPNLKYFESP